MSPPARRIIFCSKSGFTGGLGIFDKHVAMAMFMIAAMADESFPPQCMNHLQEVRRAGQVIFELPDAIISRAVSPDSVWVSPHRWLQVEL